MTFAHIPVPTRPRLPVPRTAWALVGVLATLVGCAAPVPTLRVVLLPQSDTTGQPLKTAVTLKTGQQSLTLDQPLALGELVGKGQLAKRMATLDEVQARYGDVLKIQPPSPESFVLGFLPGKSQLTPESESQLPRIIALAKSRAGGEIVVLGHTDRVGSVEANDKLSAERARAIADLLKAQGFSADLITAIGRGERDPLVPTADEVAEPRNRRAEIIIR
ncbi:MAG: flagellar motor protein MotB [Polaromonas sp.]|nr:flagellar motor protein MotB [Polaromonas sp.]